MSKFDDRVNMIVKDIFRCKEDPNDPFTFEFTLDSLPPPKDNKPYIYDQKREPNYLNDGYKVNLFSSKRVDLPVEKDSLLFLTNIRTFQQELSYSSKTKTAEAIAETREKYIGDCNR